jgi:putative SOS response-associated peptidase YedK
MGACRKRQDSDARQNERPEAFHDGGLGDLWRDPDGEELYTFTIITTDANKLLRPIHDRTVDSGAPCRKTVARSVLPRPPYVVMQPLPSELMEAYEVSRIVNDPKNDSPACIEPAVPEQSGPLFSRF